jgi:hypothetical protein
MDEKGLYDFSFICKNGYETFHPLTYMRFMDYVTVKRKPNHSLNHFP